MMNRSRLVWLAALAASCMWVSPVLAWTADEVDFPGEGNGWPGDLSLFNQTARYTGPDGNPEWFRYTLLSTSNNADFDFKMTTGNTYVNDYGANPAFPKNTYSDMFFQPNDDPSKLAGGVTNGFRYIFTALNPPLGDTKISVMELSADPVFIQQASGTFGTVTTNQVINMNMTFFTNPPPQQKAFFRISTNNFASWFILQAPITGTSASASFTNLVTSPAVTTRWYAFSSTATSNYLATASGTAIDALTITWDNRQGTNYLVKVNPKEPEFVYHGNNRVVFGSNVQFYAKAGYANSDGSDRWANFGAIYYTTDGTTPDGSKGVPVGTTKVAPMLFSFMEPDQNPIGDAMWFIGTATNLPGFTQIKYKIGLWYDVSSTERFADYNAVTNNTVYSFQLGVFGEPSLLVNGRSADYTTSKFWVDEIAGDTDQVVVTYTPGIAAAPDKVEVFSNLDRRDYADADYDNDGVPDGIKPPSGNAISTNDTGAYFRAYPMTETTPGVYVWTGLVSKTGAYRLTARYQTNGVWRYFSEAPRRDHAIVVSPKKVLEQTMYELNTLTIEAQGADQNGRSTFVDLLGVADGDTDGYDHFNIEYLNNLNANCLWFQPIHPNAGARLEIDFSTGAPYAPGSPYATKNYFAVAPQFGTFYNESNAMDEFTNFVAKCDANTGAAGSINVMLDGVFNHTAFDAIFGQGAVDLGLKQTIGDSGSPLITAGTPIGQHRWYWYADDNGGNPNYCDEADNSNDFAVAPDRGDFGKWNDVAELYFGRYAALVCLNPQDNGNYLNEGDWYDYGSMTPGVIELWKLFGYYPEYWIKKTGHSGTNSFNQALDDKGIDGLRCDFGQGLPPQIWEYIINRTRARKWNFMFMAETLDGGNPGYRSNRHFDILNESFVFQFTQAKVNNSFDIYNALEQRRNAYSGGTILLNLTSHDEIFPDDDPWVTVSRYGAVSSVDGIPMIMYGQEHGIKNFESNPAFGFDDGFIHHELNFGKYIPHFKKWNQLTVWFNSPPNSTGILPLYSRINWARLNSPALRSQNRYFLSRTGGGDNANIFAVAKYETPGAGPANGDVVLAFANLLDHSPAPHTPASDVYSLQGPWSLLGLSTGKVYSAKNIASSDAGAVLPGWPRTGQDLWDNGVFVSLSADSGQSITNDGALVQYIRLEEVDVNDAPVISLPGPHTLPVGATTNIVISVSDADNNPVTTNVTVSPAGSVFTNGVLTWTAGAAFENTTNLITVVANDQQGQGNSVVTNSTTIVVPFDFDGDGIGDGWEFTNFGTLTNPANADLDDDGMPNGDEFIAGTAPTNAASFFRVTTVVDSLGSTNRLVSVATQPGRQYTIYYTDGSLNNQPTWIPFANAANGIGTWIETNITATTRTFVDDESPNTTGGAPAGGMRNYRFDVELP